MSCSADTYVSLCGSNGCADQLTPGYLYYSNAGTFIPGTLENALKNEEPQTHFRNECLCRAMVDFNMIDTVSRGIKKMFNEQWRRHFPMPDYEIDQIKKKVVVRIYGN